MSRDIIDMTRAYLSRRAGIGTDVVHMPRHDHREGPGADLRVDRGADLRMDPGVDLRAGGNGERDLTRERETAGEAGGSIRVSTRAERTQQSSLFSAGEPDHGPDLGGLDLAGLEKLVSNCRNCALCDGRTNTVFGSGDPASRIVFVGEAPGKEEDLQGVPFVGRAGKLLTKILASIGFSREDVYITNILKCRPPGNRDPQSDEVAACEGYLARQIELINPSMICALGRVAGQNLLKTTASLRSMRDGVHYYNDIKTFVTYHPAALLRNPGFKRAAWEDMKALRKIYDESK